MLPRFLFHFMLPVLIIFPSCKRTTPVVGESSEGGIPAEILVLAGSVDVCTWDGEFKTRFSPTGLPLPGYFGFIPTESGRPPEVLILGKNIPAGRRGILPIGLIRYREIERGGTYSMVVALPFEKSLRTVQAETFRTFFIEYDALKRIVELWVRHACGYGTREVIQWEDEAAAGRLISSAQPVTPEK